MPIASAANLVEELLRHHLLTPVQELELTGDVQAQFPEPRALAKELLRRGWLTAFQINQVFQGRGAELVLGQYVLLERLGEGGMGQVFKARHQLMNRVDALKVIRPDRLAHAEGVLRFQREAQAVARLKHPNIVGLYFADRVNNTLYLAMEYLEGADLSRLIKQGPRPTVAESCEYVRQAALGLQHAFENDLVHRDIKPSNLLVLRTGPDAPTESGGVVKVLDLGLARLDPRGEVALGHSPLTRTGVLMGTPDYMAPEQAEDFHGADIRADVYSLGCTLYHLLAGKAPYPGRTLMDKLRAHESGPLPPVWHEGAPLPDGLEEVVHRMMAKRPEDRYQTPAEVAAALLPYCREGGHGWTLHGDSPAPPRAVPATPPPLPPSPPLPPGSDDTTWPAKTEIGDKPAPRRRYGLMGAVIGAVVLLVALGVGLALRKGQPAPETPAPEAPKEPEPPTVVVSQKGDGQYTTITDAVARVDEGTRIKVRPGVYKEAVRLHKRLEIVGDGPRESVVIETDQGDCITMTAEAAAVRGLTLRCRAGKDKKFSAVDVTRGKLLLEDCDLTCDSLACLAIRGDKADPTVRRCKIHDGNLAGVQVEEGGRGTVDDCDISGHKQAGVLVKTRGNPVLRRCQLHDNKEDGILVTNGGLGRFEACHSYANTLTGAYVGAGSNPVLVGCHIKFNKEGGLYAKGVGTGLMEDCEIYGNGKVGLQIEDGANPTLRRCKIRDGRAGGVLVFKKGKGRLEGCFIFHNNTAKTAEVIIRLEGDPVLTDCELHDGDGFGVAVCDKGRGTLEKCRIFGNGRCGVTIYTGGDPVLHECKINGNTQAGVISSADGGGTVEKCDLTGNAIGSIVVRAGSTLREKDNIKDKK